MDLIIQSIRFDTKIFDFELIEKKLSDSIRKYSVLIPVQLKLDSARINKIKDVSD